MSERQVDEPVEQDDAAEEEAAEAAGREGAADLAELGRRYAVAPAVTRTLRDGFRELKRHPNDAKRLAALLRGLARKHEHEARRAAEQIGRVVESIQRAEDEGR
ncbi:MAG TPA: hypothetical protein VFN74_12965 [Chloroflexota bacterium]|nr:hypothetical protein [Chloroflexota bacterium]